MKYIIEKEMKWYINNNEINGIFNDIIMFIIKNYNYFWLLMPKAKKSQLVSLTKVKPKTREHKEYIV